MFDLSVFAVGMPQQVSLIRLTLDGLGDRGYVNGARFFAHRGISTPDEPLAQYQGKNKLFHSGYILQRPFLRKPLSINDFSDRKSILEPKKYGLNRALTYAVVCGGVWALGCSAKS
jgi:hypothetical protein